MILILMFVLLYSSLTLSAPATENAMQTLDLLAFGGVGQLKYQMDAKPGGEAIDMDDSKWPIAYPGFKWEEENTDVWFRTTLEISEKIGGFSLVGRKMTLFLRVDNGAEVFVNEKSLGDFKWGPEEFIISENLQPGDKFVIAIKAINKAGFGKLYDARIELSGMVDFQKKLQDKVWGILIAKRLAKELSNNSQYWLEKIDNVTKRVMNSEAYKNGDEQGFLAAFVEEGKALQGLKNEMSQYHLYCAGYAHIDLAWMWPWIETVEVVRNTSSSVLNIMDRFPDFKYSMGQAHAYEWLEQYDPVLFKKVQEKVREGKWEIMGGQWVEPDCNLPSGESFVRQVLYGKRYFRDKFGVDVKICWIPDSFGFNWNLPQILARSGFDAFVTHKINWNDTNKFPHRFFWWEAPDGSKLMTYIPRSGYGHDLNGDQLVDYVEEERSELNLGKELVLYGVGNHGGGPTMAMLERAALAKEVPAFPDYKLCSSQEFFDSITPEEKAKLPTWDSELYLEYHRGTSTSQANTKKHNRKGEEAVQTTEKCASIAGLFGHPYPAQDIFHVWRTLLFNQFHDILPGSSINAVYHDTELEYAESEKLNQDMFERAFDVLADNIDTRGQGESLVIFNPLSWNRTGPVEFDLDRMQAKKEWSVLDESGNSLPVQKINHDVLGAKLLFIARDIPSYGYKVYRLVEKPSRASSGRLVWTDCQLKNEKLEININKNSGLVAQIRDIVNNRQVLAEPRGNLLQILPNDMNDAWNLKFTKPAIDLDKVREISLVEKGPVRATIKVVHSFQGEQKGKAAPTEDFPSSFFTQYISLYDNLPYMEVRNHMNWWEVHKVLKVAFPVNVHAKTARYEIPYANIERSTGFETSFEKARFEVSAQRWADLSDGQYGVSLINDCKYGYDIKDNIMRLSLLRSPTEPDPMCDRGYHDFKYALYPHKGDFAEGQVVRQGREFNEPLRAMQVDSYKGSLPKSYSFVKISPDNVILSSLKKAEDSPAWIVRIYETAGASADVHVQFDRKLRRTDEVNLIEDKIGSTKTSGKSFQFAIKPNEIRTFSVTFK